MPKKKLKFSVGVCAHNEEKNIGQLLEAILKQKNLNDFELDEIVVVSSGSTDKTEKIVKRKQKKDSRIKLIIQKERKGKASALNLFLKKSKNHYLILENADTLPEKEAYSAMLATLKEPNVGMVGTRIIPLNDPKTLIGFCCHLMWNLHHKISLQFPGRPKVGEVAAFKKIFTKIPASSAVDEASIEPLIHLQGYKVAYCSKAIVYNKGPETVLDFLRQRRRIYAGHTVVRRKYGYTVVTYSNFRILGTLIANVEWSNWRFFVYTPIVILLEVVGRMVGLTDFFLKLRSHTIWKIAKSTKKLRPR